MKPGSDIILVGRGHTAYAYDWQANRLPIMAVSSGIFALPEGVKPSYFAALDGAHYFNSPLNDHAIAWKNDPRARQWPFWSDASIEKHVHTLNSAPGRYRPFPMQAALEAVKLFRDPEYAKQQLLENFEWLQTHYGHQPNWGDYANVTPWNIVSGVGPNFTDWDAPVGLENMRNSVFMALQIAGRLGFKTLRLVGIFDGNGYEQHKATLARWTELAANAGISIRSERNGSGNTEGTQDEDSANRETSLRLAVA